MNATSYIRSYLRCLPYPLKKCLLWGKKAISPNPYLSWYKEVYPHLVSVAYEFWGATCPSGPKISLITLVYDPVPSHFKKCIQSVQEQSYPNFEWVLVDNYSRSNRTRRQLEELSASPFVKIVHPQKNLGIALGTFFAAERASGSWLAFLDHDDTLKPSALEDIAKVAFFRPNVKFIYSDNDHCDDVDRIYTPALKPGPSPEYLLGVNYVSHFHAIEKCLFFDSFDADTGLDGSQDWDISVKAFEAPSQVYHVPKILYTYRTHRDQFSAPYYWEGESLSKNQIGRSQMRVVKGYLSRRGLESEYEVKNFGDHGQYYLWYSGAREPAVTLISSSNVEEKECFEKWASETDFKNVVFLSQEDGQTLNQVISRVSTPYFMYSQNLSFETSYWLKQAVGLFERERDIALQSGKIFGSDGEPIPNILDRLDGLSSLNSTNFFGENRQDSRDTYLPRSARRVSQPHRTCKYDSVKPPFSVQVAFNVRREVLGLTSLWWIGRTESFLKEREARSSEVPTSDFELCQDLIRRSYRIVFDPYLVATWNGQKKGLGGIS